MTLHLRDTLSRSIRPVVPLEPSRVGIYTCGPTVYRFAHVGNLRTFLLADLIRRALLYHGLEVRHVQNITDVGHLRDDAELGDDRMLIAAGLEGRSPAEIANSYEAAFHADAALLNLLPAHVFPRATEHIEQMIELAERLEDLGHAYRSGSGNVYYAVSSYPGYGALSGNTVEALRAGHRGEVEPDKRDPADFAIWKVAGENRQLTWDAPRWGRGFPGWHLECSAMAMEHLGPRFDIHTGGEDNVFPHHEDEIAQSAPIVGGPPASHWVHGAHLLMRGRKMAKSTGNIQRVSELADEGFDPLAFRYLCLTARYGRKLAYSPTSLAAAAAGLRSLRADLAALGAPPVAGQWTAPQPLRAGAAPGRPVGLAAGPAGHGEAGAPGANAPFEIVDRAHDPAAPLSSAGRDLHDRFVAAIDDDLDLPAALRIVRETLAAGIPTHERRWLVLDMDVVLGLDLDRAWDEPTPTERAATDLGATAKRLMSERDRAREDGEYAIADGLRDELRELGIEPIDQPGAPSSWRPVQAGGTARSERPPKRSRTR